MQVEEARSLPSKIALPEMPVRIVLVLILVVFDSASGIAEQDEHPTLLKIPCKRMGQEIRVDQSVEPMSRLESTSVIGSFLWLPEHDGLVRDVETIGRMKPGWTESSPEVKEVPTEQTSAQCQAPLAYRCFLSRLAFLAEAPRRLM
jgi:hypothetical protein